MDFKGKQDRDESSTSPGHLSIQELEVNAILPTSGSDSLEVGTVALTHIVRKVLEKFFEASLERNKESVHGRYEDYRKKRDCIL
ncbi:hypothetical protein J1N35_019220 [Gossypium stocksii]|uniref:Uncharacterized protein n=1 Tax=Gossypium stocksii TaxID=47602 RepID=A0A9D3VS58_9ROSI|nr:hypothetical protein J1N35_019220 [Gossypium stocksii]